MPNLTRKATVLVGLEPAYGGVPPEYQGLLTTVPEYSPEGDDLQRDFTRTTLSPIGGTVTNKRQTLSFDTEAKGANDPADPAKTTHFHPLLLACWLTDAVVLRMPAGSPSGDFTAGETVAGDTSGAAGTFLRLISGVMHLSGVTGAFDAGELVTGAASGATAVAGADPMVDLTREYRPSSDHADMASAGVHFYADSILHQLVGVRGNVTAEFEAGQYPKLNFALTGLYESPTEPGAPTNVTFEEHPPPRVLAAGLTIDGVAPECVNKVDFDFGQQIEHSRCVNAPQGIKEIYITGRQPSANIDPEVEALSAFNPFTKWENSQGLSVAYRIGDDAGNRVGVIIPEAQIGQLGYQDRSGKRVYTLPLTPTGDDNEIILQIG